MEPMGKPQKPQAPASSAACVRPLLEARAGLDRTDRPRSLKGSFERGPLKAPFKGVL